MQAIPAAKVTASHCVVAVPGSKATFIVTSSKADFKKPGGLFVPFFMVKEAVLENDKANMEKTSIKFEDPKCVIPCYRNKRAVEAGQEILLEVSKPKKKAKT